mmetsp:Transcript_29822/g.72595  ORF Transcript_29822/g.72595 Transcript_29822/m.72595 type:complete len:92 (-) Transcript_29822:140-415(-)
MDDSFDLYDDIPKIDLEADNLERLETVQKQLEETEKTLKGVQGELGCCRRDVLAWAQTTSGRKNSLNNGKPKQRSWKRPIRFSRSRSRFCC